MSLVEIPTRSDLPWYTETVDLGDSEFRLEFAWNTRDARWFLSILTADGTPLLSGVPLVVNFPLLDRFIDSDLPQGTLWAIDLTGEGREPEQYDLGDRVRLYFEDGA